MRDGRVGGPYDGAVGGSGPPDQGRPQGHSPAGPQGGGWFGPDAGPNAPGGRYPGGPAQGFPRQAGDDGRSGVRDGRSARPAGGSPDGHGRPPGPYRDEAAAHGTEAPGHDPAGRQHERIPGPRTAAEQAARGTRRGGAGGTADGGGDGPAGPGGHRRGARRKPRSRRRKALKWVAIAAAVAVLGTAGGAYGYYQYLSSKIRKGQRVSGQTNAVKPKADANGDTPMNILVIGSDSRADAADRKLGGASDSAGARADVIMIVHLSADRSHMALVSIPRDTRVDIPQCTDPKTHHVYPAENDIINASLGRGGPGCTLATVQNLTGGLYIDHWLMIDFAGVVKMADVLGGAQVCVQQNVDDHSTPAAPGGSHLHLTAGTHTVKGEQALQWLRTRHAFGDDSMRAKAQHMYLSSLLNNLRHQNVFSNPTRLNKIATTAMSAFEVSSEIGSPKKLYDLGMQLKGVPSNRTTMLTMPHVADPLAPDAHYLPAPSAATVWSLLRNDVPMDGNGKAASTASPSAQPSTSSGPKAEAASAIPVTVANGTAGTAGGVAVPGRAKTIADTLVAAGFTKAGTTQQQAPAASTTVAYPSGGGAQGKADAVSVGKALGIPAAEVKASTDVQGITVTVGADWKTGTDYATTVPKAGEVPSDAQVVSGADDPSKNCMYVYPTYRF